jgi:two-component system, cell cycle sensor histidine kinase and response regulator CckA
MTVGIARAAPHFGLYSQRVFLRLVVLVCRVFQHITEVAQRAPPPLCWVLEAELIEGPWDLSIHLKKGPAYGLAFLLVLVASALTALEPALGPHYPFLTLLLTLLAVALGAAVGGNRAGVFFLLLGGVQFLLISWRQAGESVGSMTAVSLITYLITAGGIALLLTSQHRARLRAETAAQDATIRTEQLQRELEANRSREEAQLWNEDRYRTPADKTKDSAIVMLTPEGRHATWNQGIGRLLGYEKLEFLHANPADLYTPEDRAQGVPQTDLAEAAHEGQVSGERWIVRKDGSWFPASISITSVLDERGKLVGFAKRIRDLTEAKRIEEELRRHQEALELGYEAAGLGTVDHDLVSGKLLLDPRAAALLGIHAGDMVSYGDFLELVHPEDREVTEQLRETALAQRQPFSTQFRVVWPNGTVRWIAAVGRGSYDQRTGQPLHLRGILLDVTERKQTEERLQEVLRLEAIGRLAGGIAHDLNNMLVAIMGFSDMLARSFRPEDPRLEDVEQITRAASQSATLTRQLLAFARRELVRPRLLDLNEIIRNAVTMLRPVLGENINLLVRLSPKLGAIHADPERVEQILMNLVLNARDAMPQGGRAEIETEVLELEVSPESWQPEVEAPPAGRYAVLSVRDTGHGMDTPTLQHIWEPFFTTKPAGQGTGLGLSVVYGSVKQSGGYIWVESEVGLGTAVRVYWPELPGVPEAREETSTGQSAQGGTETLLIVEDESAVRALIVRAATSFGYHCLEAATATEAIRLLEQEQGKIDLVITDVVMPDMSGGQLGETLAHRFPKISVLYMSGFASDDVIRRGLLEPSRPFLQKPYRPGDLAHKIREVLEAKSAAKQHQTA